MIGILISNLGTPSAPTAAAVRSFLGQFLADKRVVEMPALLWKPILHGIVLRRRPQRSARAYQKIWTEQGSPLMVHAQQQLKKLRLLFAAEGNHSVHVVLGMRYGQPSIEKGLAELRAKGVKKIIVLPLYPQYSAATNASTFDEVTRILRGWRDIPDITLISNYHDDAGYIGAVAKKINDDFNEHGQPQKLLFSFHGLPERSIELGDPYQKQCEKSTQLIVADLALDDAAWDLSYQSRFGYAKWIGPATDKTLQQYGENGIEEIAVVCPGFSADCLETLEEIALQNKQSFIAAGGKNLRYIPALNADDEHINALANLLKKYF